MFRCPLAVLLVLATLPARAAVTLDLSYVDHASPRYTRFIAFVDAAVAGNPGYAFAATDAAIAFRLAGTASYCQLAVAMVEDQVADAEAEIAAGARPAIAGDSYLEVGPMLRDLALAYDWCAAYTTAPQRARWAAYAEQAVWNVWHHEAAQWGGHAHPWSGWSVDDPGNNYHYSFLEATMYWALASNSASWRQFLETQKFPALVAYYAALPGGGSREGTGYGTAHMRLFEIYRLWRDSTGTNLATQSTHATDSIDYWLHATMPTRDLFAPIGDQSRSSVPEIYDYQRNLVLQARAMANDAGARERAAWWLSTLALDAMQSGFNFRHDLLTPASSGTAPTARWYHATGTGHFFARSDWGPDAFWLGFVAGRYDQSHAHQDQGAFTLYARDWLAVTENIWSHSGIQQGAEVHNLVRFTSGGDTVRQREGTTSTLVVTANPDGSLVLDADLTPSFDGQPQVTAWTRQLRYAQRGIRVTDQFAVAAGVTATFQVNVPVVPQVSGRVARAGNLRMQVIEPADATIGVLDWHGVDAGEFNRGYRLDVRGSGNRFVVDLGDDAALFANGYE